MFFIGWRTTNDTAWRRDKKLEQQQQQKTARRRSVSSGLPQDGPAERCVTLACPAERVQEKPSWETTCTRFVQRKEDWQATPRSRRAGFIRKQRVCTPNETNTRSWQVTNSQNPSTEQLFYHHHATTFRRHNFTPLPPITITTTALRRTHRDRWVGGSGALGGRKRRGESMRK